MKLAVVVDELALMRIGVETVLRRNGLTVVGSVSTATEMFAAIDAAEVSGATVEIAVLGQFADVQQTLAVRRTAERRGMTVIALTTTGSPGAVMELCAAGATAVAGRQSAEADIACAIQAAVAGRRHVASELLAALFDSSVTPPPTPRFDLTFREREVLVELAAGKTNAEISHRLLIGTETVKTHLTNIYDKLDVRRRSHAVSLAVTHGLV